MTGALVRRTPSRITHANPRSNLGTFSGLLVLLFSCLLLTGCQPADTSQTVLLWHQMRPGDRAVLAERIKVYEQKHPGVRVRALYKETEELRSGLESAVLVGRGPDIVYGPSDTVGVYDEIGALQDLSPWFSEEERTAFDPEALVTLPAKDDGPGSPGGDGESDKDSTTSRQDRLLLVGDRFGNHLALVYNRNFIPEPPETTDELVELAVENTVDENGDGRPDRYGIAWNSTEPFFLVPFLTGHGAWFFDPEKQAQGVFEPTLDTPEMRAGMAFVYGLQHDKKVLPPQPDYETAAALFLAGKSAMLIDGDWSWQRYLKSEEIDAAVAPLPVVSSTGLPMAPMVAPKGYSLSVAAQGERAAQAADVIRFLTSEETQQQFLESQKILPSRLKVRESPLLDEDPTLLASYEQLQRGKPMPTAVEVRAVWDATRPHYQEVLNGELSPEQATPLIQRDTKKMIQALTSSVEPDATAPLVIVLGWVTLAVALWGLWKWWSVARVDFSRNRLAYLLAAPAMVLIFLTVVFPLAYNVGLSFSNMSLQDFRDPKIVGLHNYTSVFVGEDSSEFWGVFFKTIFWTVVNVAFHVAIGVFLAVVLNGPVRGKSIYRILLIIPWAVPAYITALTWRGMFDAEFGVVNQLLRSLNWINGLLYYPNQLLWWLQDGSSAANPEDIWQLGIGPVAWLTQPEPAFAACIVANVWLGFPFMMVITLGGLQGIPQDMYEAARIDRATRWQQFWHITVPMLKPVLLPAIVLGSVWTFNNLNVVWLVSNGGEPADKTHILVSYVYKAVFNLYQYGYGAALSMVIFVMLLAFSAAFLRQTKAAEGV